MTRFVPFAVLSLGFALSLNVGCNKDKGDDSDTDAADTDTDTDADADSDTDTDTDTAPTGADYRLINLVPEAGVADPPDGEGVHIFLGASPTALTESTGPIPFPGSTPYVSFPEADYEVHVKLSTDDSEIITLTGITAVIGDTGSIVLYGSIGAGAVDPSQGPAGLVVLDDTSAAPAGKARINMMHTASFAPDLNIYVDSATTPEVSGLAFGNAAGAVEIASGTVTLGFDINADATVDYSFSLDLADGGTYNLYTIGGDPTLGQFLAVVFLHENGPGEDPTLGAQVVPSYPLPPPTR